MSEYIKEEMRLDLYVNQIFTQVLGILFLISMAWSQAPYIHVILADVVSITLYINKPLVRLTTARYQSAVSMISFAQVLTAQ